LGSEHCTLRTEMQFDHEPVLSKRQKRTLRTFSPPPPLLPLSPLLLPPLPLLSPSSPGGARQCSSRIQMTNFNRRVLLKRSAPPNRNSKSACRDYKGALRFRTCAPESYASYICGARRSRIQMTNLNRR